MKVLVTGAAGFVGQNVARHLAAEGFEVTAFDRRPMRHLESSSGAAIPSRIGDFLDLESIREAARGHDVICHIGAVGDVYLAAEDPPLAAAVNVLGTATVAEAALAVGARVVYASTWEVYGRPRWEPIDEDHPCEPNHPYSITKLAGERMLMAADSLRDLPALSLRLGTVYGPGLRPNSVFRLFIDRAKRAETIVIQGDGTQSRQFTHVEDVARAFALGARSELRQQVLNIVAEEAVSIRRLAELVVARYPTTLQSGPPRPGDVPPALVSPARARSLLGWSARVSFEEGLNDLMDSLEAAA